MENKTNTSKSKAKDNVKKEANSEIAMRISRIIDFLEKEKHINIPALAKIWKTTPPNIYQLQKGFREITVAQANLLYTNFNIPHKKSLMGIGPLVELIPSSTSMLEEEAGQYGNNNVNDKYIAALKEIELLKQTIVDKNEIIAMQKEIIKNK